MDQSLPMMSSSSGILPRLTLIALLLQFFNIAIYVHTAKGKCMRCEILIYLFPSDLPSSSGWTDSTAQEGGSQGYYTGHP